MQCKHCENPACLAACRAEAIERVDGAVIVRADKCIGCKACAEACPFGAIQMVTLGRELNLDGSPKTVANKCDLCQGLPKGPACLRVCPTAALRLIQEEDLAAALKRKRQSTTELAGLTEERPQLAASA